MNIHTHVRKCVGVCLTRMYERICYNVYMYVCE